MKPRIYRFDGRWWVDTDGLKRAGGFYRWRTAVALALSFAIHDASFAVENALQEPAK